MKHSIILVGGGGHCRSCIDVIEQEGTYAIAGIVDRVDKLHQKVFGYEVIATDENLPEMVGDYDFFVVTVGQIKGPETRIKLFELLTRLNAKLPVIISPTAYVSNHARIEKGTMVMHQAIVNSGAAIGKNCIINTKAVIEHDVRIGDHCHISTAAVINGGVGIGSGTFVGSNATVRENIVIKNKSIIGFHEKVIKSIDSF